MQAHPEVQAGNPSDPLEERDDVLVLMRNGSTHLEGQMIQGVTTAKVEFEMDEAVGDCNLDDCNEAKC